MTNEQITELRETSKRLIDAAIAQQGGLRGDTAQERLADYHEIARKVWNELR